MNKWTAKSGDNESMRNDAEWIPNPAIAELLEERRQEYLNNPNATISLDEWLLAMKDKYGFQP